MTAQEVVAKWTTMPALGFDTESTGTGAHEDRIVTASIVEFQPGQRPVAHNWLVDPGVPIPEGAAAIHGWTTGRIQASPNAVAPGRAAFEISARLALWLGKGFPVVAFNVAYDITMIEAENRRHAVPTLAERLAPKPVGPFIDPMVLDKEVAPYRPAHCDGKQKRSPRCRCGADDKTLTSLCRHYGVPLIAAHTAESDAASAVRLFWKIVEKSPDTFRGMTIGGLHMAQVGWRREQMLSLRSYFDRNGIEHDGCDPAWPLLQTPAVA